MTNLAQKYGVQGYPTIKVFPPGPKRGPQDYNGPREAAGIVDYATQARLLLLHVSHRKLRVHWLKLLPQN